MILTLYSRILLTMQMQIFFSRFPLQSLADDDDLDPDVHYVFATVTDELPVTAAEIAQATKTDSLLVK